MLLLEVIGLTKFFGGLAALTSVDMHVDKGEILGLIGPNGAGKTTAFNLISGSLKPASGKIIYNEKDIVGLSPSAIAKRGISRTFQDSSVIYHDFTVLQSVFLAHYLQLRSSPWGAFLGTPLSRREDRDVAMKATAILDFLGLTSEKDTVAKNLAHGQQRTLGVAMALATNPRLLLLDEPLTGMNPQEANIMVDHIRSIRDTRGISIVIIEHRMRAVMNLCDRIVVLNYGKKIADGVPKEVRENQQVIEAYLGPAEE
jgi:branched-chain amino acid transport system ATP-binding protein